MRGAPELSNRFAAVSDTFHMKMIAIVVNLSLLIRVKKKKKKHLQNSNWVILPSSLMSFFPLLSLSYVPVVGREEDNVGWKVATCRAAVSQWWLPGAAGPFTLSSLGCVLAQSSPPTGNRQAGGPGWGGEVKCQEQNANSC